MPILNDIDRRTFSGKGVILAIYLVLALGGAAMVYPFLVTITGSLGTQLDYHRRSPLPRFLWSREDRLMRTLCSYFPPGLRNSLDELRGYFPDFPADWRLWRQVGDETAASDAWGARQLQELDDPAAAPRFHAMAEDLAGFMADWNTEETVLAYDGRDVAPFLRGEYGDIGKLNAAWHIAVNSFNEVRADEWRSIPLDQPGFLPERDARYADLLKFRQANRQHRFARFLRADPAAIGYLRPAAMAYLWENFAATALKIDDRTALAGLPFPVPADAPAEVVAAWQDYLRDGFPLRHVQIRPTPALQQEYGRFLETRFRSVAYLNRLMRDSRTAWTDISDWSEAPLLATTPAESLPGKIWVDFVRATVPVGDWTIRDTLPEKAFQAFALARHGSLAAINTAYGLELERIEQLRIPFRGAFLDTFARFEWSFTRRQALGNYYTSLDNLVLRGNAVRNTLILIVLTMALTLTVNPLAAYAMSRFRLHHTNNLLLYFVGTMAFPASVSAIPGFLLLRDLGMLNTFAALVLPTAANGMSIFLLKGFFDSLPQELFEAATIDGASEMQIFRIISLPLVKPILAVNALNAFIIAYNGWEWAILVAQDRKMWTLAVWTYQFSQIFAGEPFVVMAAFLLNSLPVFLVFLFCQKIIMRGIILPQMK
jgi:multiple sugar transport system permease protein